MEAPRMRTTSTLTCHLSIMALSLFLTACSDTKETEDGHLIFPAQIEEILNTEMHDRTIANKAMEYIRLSEDYSPETFEAQQRQAIAQMTPDIRQRALDYLPTRVQQTVSQNISNSVSLDPYSAVLGKVKWGDQVRANLRIESDNVMTVDGQRSSRRVAYTLNILIYNLDDIQYQTLGVGAP